MHFTTIFATTLLAASGVSALSAIVPPNNPSSNGEESYCTERQQCLTYINNVRASQEGLDPIALPDNWDSLTYPQRVFTFINLERTSRGLNPLTHDVNTYTSEINTAIADDADPIAPESMGSWMSIWAGGSSMIPLASIYGWMYYDGPGGYNLDCTSTKTSGCWGHRDAILNADVNKIDVGYGQDSQGQDGFAAILYTDDSAPASSDVVLAWANEKQSLAS